MLFWNACFEVNYVSYYYGTLASLNFYLNFPKPSILEIGSSPPPPPFKGTIFTTGCPTDSGVSSSRNRI